METTLSYITIAVVTTVVLLAIAGGVKYLRTTLPKNKVSEEALNILDQISATVEREVKAYVASLEGKSIKLTDIDDIIIELVFIVKGAIGEDLIAKVNELNLKEIGEEVDFDSWVKGVIRDNIQKWLGVKK